MSVRSEAKVREDPNAVLARLARLDICGDDELATIVDEFRGDADPRDGRFGVSEPAESLLKLSRGAFKPHVGGLDDIAVVDGVVFPKEGGEWKYTGEPVLEALLGDWCPAGCGPVADFYELTRDIQPDLFIGFAIMVSAQLAERLGRKSYEMVPLGEEEVRYLGAALHATWGQGVSLIERYVEAVLTFDGTLAAAL